MNFRHFYGLLSFLLSTHHGSFYGGNYIGKNRESGGMELFSFSCQIPLGGFGGPQKDLGCFSAGVNLFLHECHGQAGYPWA